eukprot:c38803_g1_i1.p1 GENE.c38803_g1_i1~~c38803_g1_i1.p1  ORF type:complete len:146 (+),score=15.16 c38803_g1_i1:575-1012(+)
MAPNLSGKWNLDLTKSEDPDKILTLQGMGWAKRKIVASLSATVDITQEADKIRLVLTTSLKGEDQTFTIGGDWADVTIDDKPMKVKTYIDGDHVVAEHQFTNDDGKKAHRTIRRYLEGDRLVQQTHIKLTESGEEANCKRYFNKA